VSVRVPEKTRPAPVWLSLEGLGAASGVIFFVVVVASFFTPEAPDVDAETATIVTELAADRDGLVLSVYLGFLASFFFTLFTAGLWTWLRRAEVERGASVLVLLGGLGSVILVVIANGVFYALVDAAEEAREPEAVRALFELDQSILPAIAVTSMVFYAGVALSALATGALPRWLTWVAAALAIAFPIALLGIFSEDDEGGALGVIFFIALLVNFVWILVTSVLMWQAAKRVGAGAPPAGRGPA
jgi:hypothetical protein